MHAAGQLMLQSPCLKPRKMARGFDFRFGIRSVWLGTGQLLMRPAQFPGPPSGVGVLVERFRHVAVRRCDESCLAYYRERSAGCQPRSRRCDGWHWWDGDFFGGVEAPKGGETLTANDKQGNALWRRSLGGIHKRGAGCIRFLKRKSKAGWLCGFVMERPYLPTKKRAYLPNRQPSSSSKRLMFLRL